MEELLFYRGILAGLYFMQGFTALDLRHKKKPYLLGFALLMLWESMTLVVGCSYFLYWGEGLPLTISSSLNYFLAPLLFLEVTCLVNQDVDSMPWSKRSLQTLGIATPLIIYFIIVLVMDIDEVNNITNAFIFIYILAVVVLILLRTNKFQRILMNETSNKRMEDRSISWTRAILALMVLQYIMYILCFVHKVLPSHLLYYSVSFVIVLLHGHFIRKQLPTDMKKLLAMQADLKEQQDEALEELKDATESMKRKLDMDTSIKAFRVEHPSFDIRLRNYTDSKLTKRDMFLCILIYQGKRTPEIADFLGISLSSVEVARHRLRTKLHLDKGTNMKLIIQSVIEDTIPISESEQ